MGLAMALRVKTFNEQPTSKLSTKWERVHVIQSLCTVASDDESLNVHHMFILIFTSSNSVALLLVILWPEEDASVNLFFNINLKLNI